MTVRTKHSTSPTKEDPNIELVRSCLREFALRMQRERQIDRGLSEEELYRRVEQDVPLISAALRHHRQYRYWKANSYLKEGARQLCRELLDDFPACWSDTTGTTGDKKNHAFSRSSFSVLSLPPSL